MKYKCSICGEKRFFYVEIPVKSKQRIDLKNGAKHGKVYEIEQDHIDGFYEDIIYCVKCHEQVDMNKWTDYEHGF